MVVDARVLELGFRYFLYEGAFDGRALKTWAKLVAVRNTIQDTTNTWFSVNISHRRFVANFVIVMYISRRMI